MERRMARLEAEMRFVENQKNSIAESLNFLAKAINLDYLPRINGEVESPYFNENPAHLEAIKSAISNFDKVSDRVARMKFNRIKQKDFQELLFLYYTTYYEICNEAQRRHFGDVFDMLVRKYGARFGNSDWKTDAMKRCVIEKF